MIRWSSSEIVHRTTDIFWQLRQLRPRPGGHVLLSRALLNTITLKPRLSQVDARPYGYHELIITSPNCKCVALAL